MTGSLFDFGAGQVSHGLGLAVAACQFQRGSDPSGLVRSQVGSRFEQEVDGLRVVGYGGGMQRRPADLVLLIGVGAGLQQAFHGDGGLGGGRQVQGGLSVSFATVGISAGIEKLVGAFCRAIGSGFMERSAAGFRAVVRAGALLQQGLRE